MFTEKISPVLVIQRILFILIISFCFNQQKLHAATPISASVNSKVIAADEYVNLEIIIVGSQFENLNFQMESSTYSVISQQTSTNIEMVNGRLSHKKSIRLSIKPKIQSGSFTIPPASLSLDNKVFKTSPIEIQVVNNPQDKYQTTKQPNKNIRDLTTNRSQQKQSNEFAVLSVENNKPYVNEQILLRLKIYHSGNLRSINPIDIQLDGFINGTKPESLQYTDFYKGREYDVFETDWIIYPVKPGIITIPSTEITVTALSSIYRPFERLDSFFNNFNFDNAFATARELKIKTEPLSINVQNLPKNPPENFNGYVGILDSTFNLLSETNTEEGEAIKISAKFEGNGNYQSLDPEFIQESRYYDIYKDTDSVDKSITGGKEFFDYRLNQAVVPLKAKKDFKIKTKEFSYFDTASNRYQTSASKTFTLNVEHSSKNKDTNQTNNNIEDFSKKTNVLEKLFDPVHKLVQGKPNHQNNNEEQSSLLKFSDTQINNFKQYPNLETYLQYSIFLLNALAICFLVFMQLIPQLLTLTFFRYKHSAKHELKQKVSNAEKEIKKASSTEEISKIAKQLRNFIEADLPKVQNQLDNPYDLSDINSSLGKFIDKLNLLNYALAATNQENDSINEFKSEAKNILKKIKKVMEV